MWTNELLLSKYLKCKGDEIYRCKSLHNGMPILCHNDQMYAVGKPGYTENYYGPEMKLSDTVSAYRITPENPDYRFA